MTLADDDEEQADLEIQAVIFKADEKDNNSVLLIIHCFRLIYLELVLITIPVFQPINSEQFCCFTILLSDVHFETTSDIKECYHCWCRTAIFKPFRMVLFMHGP